MYHFASESEARDGKGLGITRQSNLFCLSFVAVGVVAVDFVAAGTVDKKLVGVGMGLGFVEFEAEDALEKLFVGVYDGAAINEKCGSAVHR